MMTEWKAIEPLVGKVIDAERDVMSARMGGMFGRGGGRRGGDNNNNGDQPRPRRNNFFGEPSAAATALRDAIEAKAPGAELKAKLAAVRAETKAKEAALDAAPGRFAERLDHEAGSHCCVQRTFEIDEIAGQI